MIPLLFDTDIGNDIDDALALAYLLRKAQCELIGITTCTGDPVRRAELAKWLCIRAGKPDIPVVPGLSGPLLTGPGQPGVHQHPAMPASEVPRIDSEASAINFLRETIRSRPGEITLLTVGPLTNVGALFAADPATAGLLKQIVMMCGSYGLTESGKLMPTEWNAHVDPVAAGIVFRYAKPGSLIATGLDVTLDCVLSLNDFWQRFSGDDPLVQACAAMAKIWAPGEKAVFFHDPLAAALVFRPELCQLEAGFAEVGLQEGETTWKKADSGPHRVCVSVEPDAFFDRYFSVLLGAKPLPRP